MEKLIIEKINEVYVRVLCEQGARMEISEYFSFYIPNRWFNPKVKRKMWDGKVRFFDSRGSILPIGLLPKLHTFAQEFKYDIEYNFDTSKFTKQMTEENYEKFISTIFEGTKFYPYEHQSDIIYTALTKKRGVISSPTASGKSLSIYSIVRYLVASNRKTILIVPSTMLVDQMYADFKDYGWQDLDDNVTLMYSGKVPDYSKNVLITTWQSMIKKDPYILKQYKAIIADECLDGNTLISTPNGKIKISELTPGDNVYSYNESTKTIIEDEIIKVHKNLTNSKSEDMYNITLENGNNIQITGNHKVNTKMGWKEVKMLTLDDEILDISNI